jgi:hypothetical protein
MIYTNPDNLKTFAQEHFVSLEKKVQKNILKNKSYLPPYLRQYILDNLKEILVAFPKKLVELNKGFYKEVLSPDKDRFDKRLKDIFDYDWFIDKRTRDYDAYDLAKKLDMRVCTYCNRMYTITVQTGKEKKEHLTRPQFDHYFSKSKHPILALSFYNLIPSCSICNSTMKGSEEFNLEKYMHPYIDNCFDKFRFSFHPKNLASAQGNDKEYEIVIKHDKNKDTKLLSKIENTLNLFKIKETYSGHTDEVKDLLRLRNITNARYLEILRKTYKKNLNNISDDELYRLAFGTYRQEADFHKRPFSKLKKDILKELGMI